MKVYIMKPRRDHQRLCLCDSFGEYEMAQKFLAGKKIEDWEPVEVEIMEETATWKKGDYLSRSSHIPAFSARAVNHLQEFLSGHGQILPLTCQTGEYYYFNALTLLDVIDEANSTVTRLSDTLLVFNRYVLKNVDYSSFPIFRVPIDKNSTVFVNEHFVNAVVKAKLKGFEFLEVDISQ